MHLVWIVTQPGEVVPSAGCEAVGDDGQIGCRSVGRTTTNDRGAVGKHGRDHPYTRCRHIAVVIDGLAVHEISFAKVKPLIRRNWLPAPRSLLVDRSRICFISSI